MRTNTHLDVTTADVKSDKHIVGLAAEAVVVEGDIRVEEAPRVDPSFRHLLSTRLITEAAEYRVVYLYSPYPGESISPNDP